MNNTIDFNKYLNCSEELINELLEQNKNQIMKKVVNIDDNEFVFVFNKKNYDYDNQDLISMFRSVLYVKEGDKYKIINYTYNNLVYNTNIIYGQDIYESYEGSNITLFNYKNEWYYNTSKNLIKLQNLDTTNNIFFGKMILETFDNKKENINQFLDIMNKEYNYNFILVNYNNKFIHDYTDVFGLSYTKLIFTDCKNQQTQIPLEDENFNNLMKEFKNIIKPNKVDLKKVNLSDNEYVIKKYD